LEHFFQNSRNLTIFDIAGYVVFVSFAIFLGTDAESSAFFVAFGLSGVTTDDKFGLPSLLEGAGVDGVFFLVVGAILL
jgi:hypothetical protein